MADIVLGFQSLIFHPLHASMVSTPSPRLESLHLSFDGLGSRLLALVPQGGKKSAGSGEQDAI